MSEHVESQLFASSYRSVLSGFLKASVPMNSPKTKNTDEGKEKKNPPPEIYVSPFHHLRHNTSLHFK